MIYLRYDIALSCDDIRLAYEGTDNYKRYITIIPPQGQVAASAGVCCAISAFALLGSGDDVRGELRIEILV